MALIDRLEESGWKDAMADNWFFKEES